MLTVAGRNYTLEQGCQIDLIRSAKRYCQNNKLKSMIFFAV